MTADRPGRYRRSVEGAGKQAGNGFLELAGALDHGGVVLVASGYRYAVADRA